MITEKNIWHGFSREEFACSCGCGFMAVDAELLLVLRDVRKHFNTSVIINSACRCLKHNKAVGGRMPSATSKGSKHLFGLAADIVVKGVSTSKVADYLETTYPTKYGVGRYNTFTHIDVGSTYPRRWG